mgnify:CR=1 FL=1
MNDLAQERIVAEGKYFLQKKTFLPFLPSAQAEAPCPRFLKVNAKEGFLPGDPGIRICMQMNKMPQNKFDCKINNLEHYWFKLLSSQIQFLSPWNCLAEMLRSNLIVSLTSAKALYDHGKAPVIWLKNWKSGFKATIFSLFIVFPNDNIRNLNPWYSPSRANNYQRQPQWILRGVGFALYSEYQTLFTVSKIWSHQ